MKGLLPLALFVALLQQPENFPVLKEKLTMQQCNKIWVNKINEIKFKVCRIIYRTGKTLNSS